MSYKDIVVISFTVLNGILFTLEIYGCDCCVVKVQEMVSTMTRNGYETNFVLNTLHSTFVIASVMVGFHSSSEHWH